MRRPHFTPGRFLVLISVRGWVDPKAIVWLEGLRKFRKSTSSGHEAATVRLAAYCLIQLRYRPPLIEQWRGFLVVHMGDWTVLYKNVYALASHITSHTTHEQKAAERSHRVTLYTPVFIYHEKNLVIYYINHDIAYPLTHSQSSVLLENRQLCSYSRTSQGFMEHEDSLTCS
jgi:hypothetical protein